MVVLIVTRLPGVVGHSARIANLELSRVCHGIVSISCCWKPQAAS